MDVDDTSFSDPRDRRFFCRHKWLYDGEWGSATNVETGESVANLYAFECRTCGDYRFSAVNRPPPSTILEQIKARFGL